MNPPNGSIDISFFVPCYNEEKNIIATLAKLTEVLKSFSLTYEILVFDDASTDQSCSLIKKFQKKSAPISIRLFRNANNYGLGFNYIEGSYHARGQHYMLVNGDNAETPESIAMLLRKIGSAEMIIPYMQANDVRGFVRSNLSRLFSLLVNTITGHSIIYYNGPVIHQTAKVIRWHPMTCGYAYQAELVSLLLDHGTSYLEVKINHNDREHGTSKAFKLKNVLSICHSLVQMICRRTRNELWPNHKKAYWSEEEEA